MEQDTQCRLNGDEEIPVGPKLQPSPAPTDDVHEYPPLPVVLLVVCGLYIAMFLVSLVRSQPTR